MRDEIEMGWRECGKFEGEGEGEEGENEEEEEE